MATASKRQVEERKARRRRRAIYALAIIVAIPTVAIIAVNRMQSAVPAPLWTAEDLPAPAAVDNGWPLIRHYHSTTISGIDLQPIDKLLGASRKLKLAELGRLFSPARVVAGKIREHTKICSDAIERDRMVIPCLEIEAGACTIEPLQICSRLVSFAALDEASRGSPRGAHRMANVLRQLTDAAANSPHPWMQARAFVLLRTAIHHASVIIKWHRVDGRSLRDALGRVSEDSLPPRHLVIASYLLKQMALRQALDRADTWLLDEGDVMQGLNEPFEATSDGEELPPPRDHADGPFWWFDNPVGKQMLDAVQPGADEDFVRTMELRATVLKRRDEALKLK